MGEPPTRAAQSPFDLALHRCSDLIEDYEKYWRPRKTLYLGFQSAAVLLAGLTPVLLLTGIPTALQALPAAIASILGAIVAIYHWQENVARCAYASEALQSERAKFLIAHAKNEEGALENFVARVEDIRMTEVRGWRAEWRRGNDGDKRVRNGTTLG